MVVVLVGFMGAGKTTVGHIMAERLGLPFVDSDVLIEQRDGRAIRDIFSAEGEPWFRQLEHDTVAGLVRGPEAVVALGGGAVEDPRSRAVLRNARVVYLRVSYDEAMSRVQTDEFRPMLGRPDLDEVLPAAAARLRGPVRPHRGHRRAAPGRHRAGGAGRAQPAARDAARQLQRVRDPGRRHLLRPHRTRPDQPRGPPAAAAARGGTRRDRRGEPRTAGPPR